MFKISICAAAIAAAIATITGCNGQSSIFRPPSSTLTPTFASNAEPVAAITPPSAGMPATPYVLRAESAGPYINFSIYNLGETDMLVEQQHFAVISQGNREVFPYNQSTTIIDLPQPPVVKPNGMIEGRAIFKDVTSPDGKRLVYKPDAAGTFADISKTSSRRPAAGAPGAMTAQ